METQIQPEQTHPFELCEDESIKYEKSNLQISIKGSKEDFDLASAILILTTQRVIIYTTQTQKLLFHFDYQNAITHGLDKKNFMVMISDLVEAPPAVEGEEEEEDEDEDDEPDFLFEKAKQTDSFDPIDFIQLVGNYQVIFNYTELGQDELQKVFSTFSECSAMNPDENASLDGEGFDMNEFITADDIDENGKLKTNKLGDDEEVEDGEGGDGEDEEWEDESQNGKGDDAGNGKIVSEEESK